MASHMKAKKRERTSEKGSNSHKSVCKQLCKRSTL